MDAGRWSDGAGHSLIGFGSLGKASTFTGSLLPAGLLLSLGIGVINRVIKTKQKLFMNAVNKFCTWVYAVGDESTNHWFSIYFFILFDFILDLSDVNWPRWPHFKSAPAFIRVWDRQSLKSVIIVQLKSTKR